MADRCARLLSRGGALALELERLQSCGIWVLTRADEEYPTRYKQRLRQSAPAVLFGAGDRALLGQPGVAVVGSRHLNPVLEEFVQNLGISCARSGLVLYSGGAKGVDNLSSGAALQARGTAVSVLAHSLEAAIRAPDVRQCVAEGHLALITPYVPNAGFNVGAAMGRNKLIYTLADQAIVISSDQGKGGTWTGATEALSKRWVPVFVLDGDDVPEGNRALLQKGAQSFPVSILNNDLDLPTWLSTNTSQSPANLVQGQLF